MYARKLMSGIPKMIFSLSENEVIVPIICAKTLSAMIPFAKLTRHFPSHLRRPAIHFLPRASVPGP